MLTDLVYNDLREKILSLSLKPGTPLSFTNLKPLYNVSISPIRDALKRLEGEGLIEIKPQSGTSVALIDFSKVSNERFARLYLELGAVEKCFEKGISESLVSKLEEIIQDQHKAFECRDTVSFLNLDDAMHRLFFEECGHQKVFDFIQANSGNYHRIRMVSYLFDDILINTLSQHEDILKALKKGCLQEVLERERKHRSRIEAETSGYQRSYPQFFK